MLALDRLTFTRFLAALGIVFFHFGQVPAVQKIFVQTGNGYLMVSYFYCLSGFIMATVYVKGEDNSSFLTGRYYLARFARIYPVYLLALVLFGFYQSAAWPAWVLSLLMLQAWISPYPLTLNSPGWSVSCELFFYLLFPLLIPLLEEKRLKFSTPIILLCWAASQVLEREFFLCYDRGESPTWHDILSYMPYLHVNQFLLGALVAAWCRPFEASRYGERHKVVLKVLLVPAILSGGIFIYQTMVPGAVFVVPMQNGALAPLFLYLIIWVISGVHSWKDVLANAWLVLLGEASYALYILQFPLWKMWNAIIINWHLSADLVFFIFLPLLVLVSLIVHKTIENPLRKKIQTFYRPNSASFNPILLIYSAPRWLLTLIVFVPTLGLGWFGYLYAVDTLRSHRAPALDASWQIRSSPRGDELVSPNYPFSLAIGDYGPVCGNLETLSVSTSARDAINVRGWSAYPDKGRVADCVLIFEGSRCLASTCIGLDRPDIAEYFKKSGLARSGYSVDIPIAKFSKSAAPIRVLCVSEMVPHQSYQIQESNYFTPQPLAGEINVQGLRFSSAHGQVFEK